MKRIWEGRGRVDVQLFGTDAPIRTSEEHAKALAAYGFSASDLLAIERENARRLLPQLRKA